MNSGYSVESRDITTRLKEDGWQLAYSSMAGNSGGTILQNGIVTYPVLTDQWGSDAMVMHARHFQANAVFTMLDVPVLNPQFLAQLQAERRVWIPYLPIDQEPIPPPLLGNLRFAYRIITFSKYGQKALEKEGFSSTLIYEGTDTNIFKPMDKQACRKEIMGVIPPDAFVIGMIGANKENPSRKGWQQALEAFKIFYDRHPESVFFYESNQNYPGGFPIDYYAKVLGIEKQVFHIDQYMSVIHSGSEVMAKMLNAFDMTLHCSMTEGFGLVIIESQACGTPVIVNNCHSQPELVIEGKTGEITKTGQKHFSQAGGYWYYPDVDSMVEKMEITYKRVKESEKMVEDDCVKWVDENFNIDKIVSSKWLPFLEDLQKEILPSLVDTQ